MIDRIKHTSGLLIVVLLVAGFYALSLVVVSYAISPQSITTSVSVNSVPPIFPGGGTNHEVTINSGNPITLTENTTTPVTCQADIDIPGGIGDLTQVNSWIYRTGVASSCLNNITDDNFCYAMTTTSTVPSSTAITCVTSTVSSTVAHVICTAQVWFHAESTDASSSWPTEKWECDIDSYSTGGNVRGTSTLDVELNSLAAQDINPTAINYGSLDPNTVATHYTESYRVYNTGNIRINTLLKGSSMSGPGSPIAPSNQHYGVSSTNYAGNAALSGTDTLLDLEQTIKPTNHSPSNVDTRVNWAIDIPNGQTPGAYYGVNTSTVISAI